MNLAIKFDLFFQSLISPYKYHGSNEYLSISDSVVMAWVFAVLSGIFKLFLLNLVLVSISSYFLGFDLDGSFLNKDGNFAYYFLILSTILEIIFFPLFTLFIVQFWTFIIRSFARFLKVEGDVDLLVQRAVIGSLSSHIFMAVPIFGGFLQNLSSLVQLFIGMRVQLKFSPSVAICTLLSPIFFLMTLFIILTSFGILQGL